MLSVEDNELVTNTDPGTPMGELFRRFWLPVALSDELPGPDCVPVKLKIMNEDLIAFRDSDGKVGVIDAFCPHRGAPMYFARNEESGLRCVYHGWKFDVTGQCVDLPNTPEGDTFVQKVKTIAYPTFEAGGMVFAYMGPKEKQPPIPDFDFAKVPAENIYVTKFQLECNWLQATEGDFDPSHGVFLHSTLDNNASNPGFTRFGNRAVNALSGRPQRNFLEGPVDPNEPYPYAVGNRRFKKDDIRAKDQLVDIDGAFYAIARVPLSDGSERVSLGLRFLMPAYCPPGVARPGHYSANIRVPIDNEKMMFFRLRWSLSRMTQDDLVEYRQGGYAYPEMIPGTWKTRANVFNDYEVDRLGQKTHLYSGIKTFPLQDIAMMENQWGPIAKREREHLVAMDYHMIYLRRKLIAAAKAMKDGIEPQEPWIPEAYHYHSASAEIKNGDIETAIEEAKRLAKQTVVPEARLEEAPQLSVG
ncbi:MAG TPA: Rieske 2Fe-2S domain-containing protein [Dehalococcoidia bacterium]|jgi:nitrite reductase/ring-hydroxylating ferredoxin subunit|nr:Rieske 2Fe-2S domain-containing protein [Dehalococcoidia bacterium]